MFSCIQLCANVYFACLIGCSSLHIGFYYSLHCDFCCLLSLQANIGYTTGNSFHKSTSSFSCMFFLNKFQAKIGNFLSAVCLSVYHSLSLSQPCFLLLFPSFTLFLSLFTLSLSLSGFCLPFSPVSLSPSPSLPISFCLSFSHPLSFSFRLCFLTYSLIVSLFSRSDN